MVIHWRPVKTMASLVMVPIVRVWAYCDHWCPMNRQWTTIVVIESPLSPAIGVNGTNGVIIAIVTIWRSRSGIRRLMASLSPFYINDTNGDGVHHGRHHRHRHWRKWIAICAIFVANGVRFLMTLLPTRFSEQNLTVSDVLCRLPSTHDKDTH